MREHDRLEGRPTHLCRPRFMVWENVPGAFSSNGGKDFQTVLTEIARIAEPDAPDVPLPEKGRWTKSGAIYSDLGNWSIAWRVHDAQFWGCTQWVDGRMLIAGTPQRRKRISLIADFAGLAAPEILFERKGVSWHPQQSGEARERTAAGTESSVGRTSAGIDTAEPIPIHDQATRFKGKHGGKADGKGNGLGIGNAGDPANTLSSADKHAIYDSRGNGGGETCPTITGDHQNRVTDYTAIALQRSDSSSGSRTK